MPSPSLERVSVQRLDLGMKEVTLRHAPASAFIEDKVITFLGPTPRNMFLATTAMDVRFIAIAQ